MKTFLEWFFPIGGFILLMSGLKDFFGFKETYMPRKEYSNDWDELFMAIAQALLGSFLLLTSIGGFIGIVK